MLHQRHHHTPVHQGSSAPHEHEPGDTSTHMPRTGALVKAEARAHVGREHSRSLCIAVDDFGLHAGVCQAALALARQERVHAIGCMVGAPAWARWAPELKALDAGRVDVGLHLDLTEYPLHMALRPLHQMLVQTGLHTLQRASVRAEIGAQLDAFERHMGRAPRYVDGHQHVHQLPIVRDELLAELQRRYAGHLPWLRCTRVASMPGEKPGWRHALKPRVISALGSAGLAARARRMGFQQNTRLLGVHDFTANEAGYAELLQTWLRGCRRGDVLMCHPAASDHAPDALAAARLAEYQTLSGEAFALLVREQGIVLQALSTTLDEDARAL